MCLESEVTAGELTKDIDQTESAVKHDLLSSASPSDSACSHGDEEVTRVGGKAVDFYTSGHLLTGEELLDYCRWLHKEHDGTPCPGNDGGSSSGHTVIGLVSVHACIITSTGTLNHY